MKNIGFMLCSLLTLSSYAGVTQVKCKLDGTVFLNGKDVKFSDNSIVGKVTEDFIIFDESDPNYQHVRKVKLQNGQIFTYAIEGYNVENGTGTVTIRTERNTSPVSQATSYFRMPLKQKRFVGYNGASLEKSKESHQLRLTC